MTELRIRVKTISATLPASGEGYGSLLDTDIVFDDLGLPFLPARRIKGILRESAEELVEMFDQAGINCNYVKDDLKDNLFGLGKRESTISIDNFYLEKHEELKDWLKWAYDAFPRAVSPMEVLDVFTGVRQQTAIGEDGIAKQGSLRTARVLKSDLTFEGRVFCNVLHEREAVQFLALTCANVRHMGTMRNRGLGEIACSLWEGDSNQTEAELKNLEGII